MLLNATLIVAADRVSGPPLRKSRATAVEVNRPISVLSNASKIALVCGEGELNSAEENKNNYFKKKKARTNDGNFELVHDMGWFDVFQCGLESDLSTY